MQYEEQRTKIVDVSRGMITRGLTEHTSGNVSCRLPDSGDAAYMAITPHGLDYFEMEADDIVIVDADGETVAGDASGHHASAEKVVHLEVYAARPDVRAVMHSHPADAEMLAVARTALPSIIDEAWVELGPEVRVADYGISGTPELAKNVVAVLGNDRACLMASHGMLAAGRDLEHALEISELIEHLCRVYVGSLPMGGPQPLGEDARNLYRGVYEYTRQQENEAAE